MENKLPDTPWHMGYAKKRKVIQEGISRDVFITKMEYANVVVQDVICENVGVQHIAFTIQRNPMILRRESKRTILI